MAELEERCPGKKTDIPYEVGQPVCWTFYDWVRVMYIREKGPNYVSVEDLKDNRVRFRVYEDQIEKELKPV